MSESVSRRAMLQRAAAAGVALALPGPLAACIKEASRPLGGPDQDRLQEWAGALQGEGLSRAQIPLGRSVVRVGELARGTPYQPGTLDAYLRTGGNPAREPLTLSLTRFDCVTLVEACLSVSRAAVRIPTWEQFGSEIERMRYRGGIRNGYASRLHYFSEWITDGEQRGLVRDLGGELGGVEDMRPLRFMTEYRSKYAALADERIFQEIRDVERRLDGRPRRVIPTKRLPQIVDRMETGDVLAFATEISGLDVTHAALAYRDTDGKLRVLHAPLSGGVVEVTRTTVPEYVAAIRHSTGVLVARPLWV